MLKILLSIIGVLSMSAVTAHPASKISFAYDAKTMELTATVEHDSKNPTKHFIDEVEVKLNGKVIKTEEFKEQTDTKGLVYKIKLEKAQKGDKIEIETDCNKGGDLSAEFVIP